MKRKWMVSFLLGLFLLFIIVACTSEKETAKGIPGPTASPVATLLFLGNKNIAPVVYLDGTTPSGVAVDIVNALARHISQPVEIQAMDWSEAQTLVAQGEADALIQINSTEARKKIYDFSDPLLESHFSIFVRTEKMGISGLSSLRGLRVGVESGGLPQQLIQKDPQILMTIIPNFLEGFHQLNEGTIDAVIVDYRVGSYVLAKNNIRNIKEIGEPIESSYSAIAVKKGNTKLLNEINQALKIIKSDGTYEQILNKWKPTEGVFETQAQITGRYLYVALVVLFILFLIAIIWMVSIRQELIKRKAIEEKLREQNSTLSGIINSANALIFSVDREYRYTSFNDAHASVMQAIYGVTIQPGNNILDYMTVSEDREKAKQNLDRAFAGERLVESAYSGEEERSRLYFEVSHDPIRAEDGTVIGVAVLSRDITGQKHAEEEIRRLNEGLEQRVLDRTIQLEAANKELEAFAYSVSHDLRVPLRHIDGFLKLLQERMETSLDDKSLHYMTVISDSTKKMGILIDDLLSFSRMGRNEMVKSQVPLQDLVQDVLHEFSREVEDRNINWKISPLPTITGDRAMLRIVLVNLISNALKFTRHRPQAEIEIGSMQDHDMEMIIFVRDNGAGFDMKYMDKLFGVFQRLHSAEEFEGTGIGLANVRRIINRHGGKTWAEGEVDNGATFYFSLPKVDRLEP
jgi:PAS domain S-box-containing protein